MSLTGPLLGIINIAIVVAILLLIGAIILWFCSWMSLAVPDMVRKLYIAVVALIGLYMLIALLPRPRPPELDQPVIMVPER